MKNIYILPTDKPSKIAKYLLEIKDTSFFSDKNGYAYSLDCYHKGWSDIWQPQNIYITDDSKLKGGDYAINSNGYLIKINQFSEDELSFIPLKKDVYCNTETWHKIKCYKKIILTDNKDLIADGVQELPEDFYSWFLKTPSCEFVEVIPIGFEDREDYLIIIPKEESKQETQIQQMEDRIMGKNVDTGYRLQEEPKQDFPMQGLIDKMENDKTLKGTMTEAIQRVVSSQVDSINELNVHLKAEQIQNECHKFAESVPNVTYQDATNTFIFMKLAELTKNMNENLEKIVSKEPSKFWAESDARKRNRETLEEAMEKNGYHDKPSDDLWREGVEFGAKHQAEQYKNKYSEEELLSIFEEWKIFDENQDSFSGKDDLTFKQWFELKKKK
jgi:hypothetical protein